jgi:hypothetical protein
MSDHPLDGFNAEDALWASRRSVSFDRAEQVLTVHLHHEHETEVRHFRLTEVKQQWVEVDEL